MKILPDERRFGLLMVVVFALIAFVPLLHGGAPRYWSIAIATGMLVAALFWPKLLAWPCRAWFGLSNLLHHIVSPVIMGVLFFCVFTPAGLLMRAIGKRPLALQYNKKAKTYWIDRKQPAPAKDSMKFGF